MARFHRIPTAHGAVERDKNQLWAVPKPARDPRMQLADLVGAHEVAAIEQFGQIQFQATGDTGVGLDSQQEEVAQAMRRDVNVRHPQRGPIFFLNLGDIIYGPHKRSLYANRFYRPNIPYLHPAPGFDGIILGIPGNHDGEVRDPADAPSLSAFWENFCADPGTHPPMAESFGVVMPNQPGAYWHLAAPFLDLIGLYSNAAEDFGLLGQDATDTHQQEWLTATLTTLQQERSGGARKALVVAVHHPPYNRGLQDDGFGHGGSPRMQAQIDAACAAAGVWPDAVLSGHSHNYQRYMRHCTDTNGRDFIIPYVVAGTGGIKTQAAPFGIGNFKSEAPPPPSLLSSEVSYAMGLESFGYLRVTATAQQLKLTFVRTEANHRNEFETVIVDLATQKPVFP